MVKHLETAAVITEGGSILQTLGYKGVNGMKYPQKDSKQFEPQTW